MCHVFLQPSALPVTLAIENKKITRAHTHTPPQHAAAVCTRSDKPLAFHQEEQSVFSLSLHFTSWSPQPLRSAPPRDSTISAVEFTSTVYVWL